MLQCNAENNLNLNKIKNFPYYFLNYIYFRTWLIKKAKTLEQNSVLYKTKSFGQAKEKF